MWSAKSPIRILVSLDQAIGFNRDAFTGVAQAVQGYDGVILDLNWANVPLQTAVKLERPAGIILAESSLASVTQIAKLGIPCVNVANCLDGHAMIPVVGNDDKAVGQLIAEFFVERGFECFGFICTGDNAYFKQRREAFSKAIAEAGFHCEVMPALSAQERSSTGAVKWIANWLRRFEKPMGVMCPFDADAREVTEAAHLEGIRVPEKVSIVGVDNDLNMCMTTMPTLSSVATAASRIGRLALQELLAILDGSPPSAKPVLIPPTGITERGSTGEVAVSDRDVANAIHFMRNNLRERITISTIAELAATSRRTLERKFLESVGRTPLQELRRLRIARAKRLLLSTDLELKEVARSSGLIHVQRLSKLIKEETGLSPAKLRRTQNMSR